MKPVETKSSQHRTPTIVMLLCLAYGGFAVMLFILDIYSAIWSGSSFLSPAQQSRFADQNRFESADINRIGPPSFTFSPVRIISSPVSLLVLFSGIISLIAGITIWRITREHEIRKIKTETAEYLLLPDEKKVIAALKANDYALAQSQITRNSGLSKVQVHRVIKRLESKGLIEKHAFGLTNKIVLKKEFFE